MPGDAASSFEQSGPGTWAGRYMRRFWQPIHLGHELGRARARTVQVLSEEFTLFRDAEGVAHLVEARCPHRGARLALGWVEADGIRCRYHGWKFSASGQCLEQPAEQAGFAHKVCIRSYPCVERFGIVFGFLGDGAAPPAPELFSGVDEDLRFFHFTMVRHYNFFQDLENLVDDVHLSFLHSLSSFRDPSWGHAPPDAASVPMIEADETEFGLLQRSRCPNGKTRAVAFLMPNSVYFKTVADRDLQGFDAINWAIPIDDRSHMFLQLVAVPKHHTAAVEKFQRLFEQPLERGREQLLREFDAEVRAVLGGDKTLADLPKRGLETVHLEDCIMQTSQGIVADRTRETLGRSDRAVILLRKLWTRELAALAKGASLTPFRVSGQLPSLRRAVSAR